jgi:protein Mpv17
MIAGSGDAFCQYIVYHNKKDDEEDTSSRLAGDGWWDAWRTGRFFAMGCAFVAPIVHVWYGTLLTRFPGTPNVWKRLALDQLVFNPIFTPAFMGLLGLLEQQQQLYQQPNKEKDKPELWDRLVRDVPDAIVMGWGLWVPAQYINFRFIPGKYQVLFSNGTGFVWNIYLSWKMSHTSTVPSDDPFDHKS